MSYIGTQPTQLTLETRQEFVATASQTTFNTNQYTVGYVDCYLNGVKLSTSDFTANNGNQVVLGTGATAGDILAVVMKKPDHYPLPITDSAGNNVLSESGGVVTLTADAAVIEGSSSGDLVRITQTGSGNALVVEDSANPDSTPFVVNASGNVLIGTTIASTVGENLQVFRDNAEVASFLRYTDGTLVNFKTGGGAIHGSISISGVTCSYNSFAGSHWSQLKDGSKSEILCGTVMEAIDELVEWPNEPTNSNLCKVKISDNAGTKKVYGVFMGWDEDWTATNDMLVTALGAFLCRVNNSEIVHQGDLLESNGDGTARVQSDDVIRSSTIGKVTSTAKTLVYDDGSYCVPTVLYCG